MPEANPNQPHPSLLEEDLLDEVHQLEDPDVVVEGVETWESGQVSDEERKTRIEQNKVK